VKTENPFAYENAQSDGWYVRTHGPGSVISWRNTHQLIGAPPSIVRPTALSLQKTWNQHNHAFWSVLAREWNKGTNLLKASYFDATIPPGNQVHNIYSHLYTPNAWELFCWHQYPALKCAAFSVAITYGEQFIPRPRGGIVTGYSEKAAPTVSAVTVKSDGSVTLTWTLSFSSMNPLFMIAITPPGAAFILTEYLVDIWAINTTGNTPPFTRALGPSLTEWPLLPLPVGAPVLVGVRQCRNLTFSTTDGNSAWGVATATVEAA